jgi:hypothetical protein
MTIVQLCSQSGVFTSRLVTVVTLLLFRNTNSLVCLVCSLILPLLEPSICHTSENTQRESKTSFHICLFLPCSHLSPASWTVHPPPHHHRLCVPVPAVKTEQRAEEMHTNFPSYKLQGPSVESNTIPFLSAFFMCQVKAAK